MRDDTSLPLATMRAIMNGFQRAIDPGRLEPFVDPYFAAIGPVWEQRDIDTAIAFARGMFPRSVISDDVLAKTRGAFEGDHPGPVRRILIEGEDQMARALRARACDARAH